MTHMCAACFFVASVRMSAHTSTQGFTKENANVGI